MSDKLTKEQKRILHELYTTDKITLPLGGGSARRMLTRMYNANLVNVHNGRYELTAKGLKALAYAGVEIPGEVHVARERLEQERKEQYAQEEERYQTRARVEAEERKARIIAKVRDVLDFTGDDNELWRAICGIVEIHEATQ